MQTANTGRKDRMRFATREKIRKTSECYTTISRSANCRLSLLAVSGCERLLWTTRSPRFMRTCDSRPTAKVTTRSAVNDSTCATQLRIQKKTRQNDSGSGTAMIRHRSNFENESNLSLESIRHRNPPRQSDCAEGDLCDTGR